MPDEILVDGDDLYVRGGTTFPNVDNCGNAGVVKMVAPTQAGLDRLYSALLTSVSSGKTVVLYLDGCAASPWGYTVPRGYFVAFHR